MTGVFSLSAYASTGLLVGVVWVNPPKWYRKYRFFKDRGISAYNCGEWIWVPASVVFWPIVLVLLCFKWWFWIVAKVREKRERIRTQEEYRSLKAKGWEEEWIYPENTESRRMADKENPSVVGLALKHESKEAGEFLAPVDRLKVMNEWLRVSLPEPEPLIRLVDPELNRRRKLAWESQKEINVINHVAMIRENLKRPGLSDHERRIISNLRQRNSYYDPLEDDPEKGPIIKQVTDEVRVKNAGQRLRCHSLWSEIALTLRDRHGIIWFPPPAMNPGVIYD